MEIEDSSFFDMSHASGSRPGPKTLKPFMPVVWEVHPISRIVMELSGSYDALDACAGLTRT